MHIKEINLLNLIKETILVAITQVWTIMIFFLPNQQVLIICMLSCVWKMSIKTWLNERLNIVNHFILKVFFSNNDNL